MRPITIIRTELMKDINTSVLQHKDFKSVRKAIYWKKRKRNTVFSETLIIEAVTRKN